MLWGFVKNAALRHEDCKKRFFQKPECDITPKRVQYLLHCIASLSTIRRIMLRYGLLILLGLGLPLALVITQTGTTRFRCDRLSTGVVCQQEQTLLYGLLSRPQRSMQVSNVRFEEKVRSANDGDRTYTIYTVYLETDQGNVPFESTRNRATALESLAEMQALLGGKGEPTLTQTQGSLERTLAATIMAVAMVIGALLVWTRAKP